MYLEVEAEEQRRETNPWKKVVQSEREIRGKGRRPHRSCHFALRNAGGFHRPPSLARISTFQSLCFRKNSLSLSAAHKSRRVSPNKPMGSFLILRGPMRFQDISISSFVHSLVLCPSNNSFYTSWQLLRHVGGFYIFFYSKY